MTDESAADAFVAIKNYLKGALDAGEYRAAKKALQAAIEELKGLSPSHRPQLEAAIWRDYSVIASHYGDPKTAIEYEEKLAARFPEDPYPHLSLSRLYGETGQAQKAAESLHRCAELAKSRDDRRLLDVLITRGHHPTD